VLLTLSASWNAWSRVYFYAIVGTILSTAFFASPAKPWLKRKLEERAAKVGSTLKKSHSQESLAGQQPLMVLPPQSLVETIGEIKMEIEAGQSKGLTRNTTL
jgi:lysophospholipid acyltransferase